MPCSNCSKSALLDSPYALPLSPAKLTKRDCLVCLPAACICCGITTPIPRSVSRVKLALCLFSRTLAVLLLIHLSLIFYVLPYPHLIPYPPLHLVPIASSAKDHSCAFSDPLSPILSIRSRILIISSRLLIHYIVE
ncbi:hypothetical protein Ciccas_003590 [Cichlidogyrus casuarinus]|uniref:Uncharacterized protein n=1 Tax=Cichlidogyrus casuarinus TaxID=1844966 RepID=A0ABD2QDZ7_9PLAT